MQRRRKGRLARDQRREVGGADVGGEPQQDAIRARRCVDRRAAGIVPGLGVGAAREQRLGDIPVICRQGEVQCRRAVVAGAADVGAVLQQPPGEVELVARDRLTQRRHPVCTARIRVGAARKQEARDVLLVPARRQVQWRAAIGARLVDVGAMLDEGGDELDIADGRRALAARLVPTVQRGHQQSQWWPRQTSVLLAGIVSNPQLGPAMRSHVSDCCWDSCLCTVSGDREHFRRPLRLVEEGGTSSPEVRAMTSLPASYTIAERETPAVRLSTGLSPVRRVRFRRPAAEQPGDSSRQGRRKLVPVPHGPSALAEPRV